MIWGCFVFFAVVGHADTWTGQAGAFDSHERAMVEFRKITVPDNGILSMVCQTMGPDLTADYTTPLVPPAAPTTEPVPVVYCHAQGLEWRDGKCVKRQPKGAK